MYRSVRAPGQLALSGAPQGFRAQAIVSAAPTDCAAETKLHYVTAGKTGLCWFMGFQRLGGLFESSFPCSLQHRRVFAVDLRGFGDSDNGPGVYGSEMSAEDLHFLIKQLNVGPTYKARKK